MSTPQPQSTKVQIQPRDAQPTITADGVLIRQEPSLNSPANGEGFSGNPFDIQDTTTDGDYVPDCGSTGWHYGVVTRSDLNPPQTVTGWVSICFVSIPE